MRLERLLKALAHLVDMADVGLQAVVEFPARLRDQLGVVLHLLLLPGERHGAQERQQQPRCRDQHSVLAPSVVPQRRAHVHGRVEDRIGRHVHHHEVGGSVHG